MKLLRTGILGVIEVITSYRQSSAHTDYPLWYYETIVWEVNNPITKGAKMIEGPIDSGVGYREALRSHLDIVADHVARAHPMSEELREQQRAIR